MDTKCKYFVFIVLLICSAYYIFKPKDIAHEFSHMIYILLKLDIDIKYEEIKEQIKPIKEKVQVKIKERIKIIKEEDIPARLIELYKLMTPDSTKKYVKDYISEYVLIILNNDPNISQKDMKLKLLEMNPKLKKDLIFQYMFPIIYKVVEEEHIKR